MAMHKDLPKPPRGPKWVARGLLLAGVVVTLVGAAHFAGVREMDPNLAFVCAVLGLLVFAAGVVRRVTLPRRADVLRTLYGRAEPIRMLFAIRPVEVKGQQHVEYVADLWPPEAFTNDEPAAWVRLDRIDPYGVPWFTSLHDGQEAWVHGGGLTSGPILLEIDDRLILPATLSSSWRKGDRGGKKWHRSSVKPRR
jgi:hypothetical protein